MAAEGSPSFSGDPSVSEDSREANDKSGDKGFVDTGSVNGTRFGVDGGVEGCGSKQGGVVVVGSLPT